MSTTDHSAREADFVTTSTKIPQGPGGRTRTNETNEWTGRD